ncbi:hypothetical protein VNI00_011676 [Paramarasmius palmivorus]|uniref:F-box domain-containing protein n=1 Tax=Paramarasmius palmivorus TaxID=297713 RepID=A0AAW0CCI2_9AGAR
MVVTDPVELCSQCHRSFPEQTNHFSVIEEYLLAHPGNHVPLGSQSVFLYDAVKETEAQLAGYETDMRESTRRYEEKRNALTSIIQRMRVLVRPSIHHLPPETLSSIFLICRRDSEECWDTRSQRNTSIALTLSHVCSKWRSISFSLPDLWSQLNFSFQHGASEKKARKLHSFATLCLEKSKERPLAISLSVPLYRSVTLHIPILNDLLRHSHRWRNVEFKMSTDFHLPQSLPMLESLTLWGKLPASDTPAVSSPLLLDLRLSCIGDDMNLHTRFDIASLTHLTIVDTDCGLEDLFVVLQKCPMLSSLHFSQCVDDYPDDNALTPVTLASLRSMTLGNMWSDDEFFSHLTLPSITHFAVSGSRGDPYYFQVSTLIEMLQRSRTESLVSLKFDAVVLDPEPLVDLLLETPSLETFDIYDSSAVDNEYEPIITDWFLQQMTLPRLGHKESAQILLPNLIHLHIDTPGDNFESDSLHEMILSRWDKDGWESVEGIQFRQLQSFRLACSPSNCGKPTMHFLENLREEGLQVELELENV